VKLNIHHFFQIDLPPKGENPSGVQRFWMDSCGGRDQVARQISAQGWRAYEAPLPTLIEAWCSRLQAVFLDIGANTGFYSLLAATSGARHVHAFEPVTEIADVLKANVVLSEFRHKSVCTPAPWVSRLARRPCISHWATTVWWKHLPP